MPEPPEGGFTLDSIGRLMLEMRREMQEARREWQQREERAKDVKPNHAENNARDINSLFRPLPSFKRDPAPPPPPAPQSEPSCPATPPRRKGSGLRAAADALEEALRRNPFKKDLEG